MQTRERFVDVEALRVATFVRHVEIHAALGSTNDRAAELARDPDVELPALVVARHQSAGRGRSRKTWWSAEGALTFSLLLEPGSHGIDAASWPQLSLAAAVAVCDALQREAPRARLGIKWPNDVLLDGRKISGILLESPGGPKPVTDRVIIGIGINVNNTLNQAPPDAKLIGTALSDTTGRPHDLQTLLVAVLKAMAARIAQLGAHDIVLTDTWQALNLLASERLIVEAEGRQTAGLCVEIARDGALIIETAFGCQRVYSGSVRRLK